MWSKRRPESKSVVGFVVGLRGSESKLKRRSESKSKVGSVVEEEVVARVEAGKRVGVGVEI